MIPATFGAQLPPLPPEDGAVSKALADVDTRLAAWSQAVGAAEATLTQRSRQQVDQARRLIGYAEQLRSALRDLRLGTADDTTGSEAATSDDEAETDEA